jgi:hypothetical protein
MADADAILQQVATLSPESRAQLISRLRESSRTSQTDKLTQRMVTLATEFKSMSKSKFISCAKSAWVQIHPTGSVWTPEQLGKRSYQTFLSTAMPRIRQDNPTMTPAQAMKTASQEWRAAKQV